MLDVRELTWNPRTESFDKAPSYRELKTNLQSVIIIWDIWEKEGEAE